MATKKPNPLGSLVPKADVGLINQAYKMSMANVPVNLSPTFNAIGNAYARGADALGKGIGKAFETAGEIYAKVKEENDQEDADTKTSKKFKNGSTGEVKSGEIPWGYEEDYQGDFIKQDDPETEDDEYDIKFRYEFFDKQIYTRKDLAGNDEKINVMNFEDHQKFLKNEKKKIKKKYKIGDPKRKELLQNLKDREDRARESSILFSKTEIEIDQIIADGDLSENMTNIKKVQFLRAIKNNGALVDDGNGNKSRALMGFNSDGEIVFSYVDEKGIPIKDSSGNPITVSPGNAKNLITKKNSELRNGLKNIQNDYLTQGTDGVKITDAYSKKQQDNIVSLITDKKKFNDVLGFKPDGFSQNFEQAVLGFTKSDKEISNIPEKILSSFPKNFVEDTDGVEGVSAGDFKTEENYKKLSNALLDSSDPNFNLSRSAELVGEFMNSKFKTDGAGAYQGYLANPDNAGEIERQRKANIVETPPPELTGRDLMLQNMSKTESGRQTINRFNTFTNIITSQNPEQLIIDLKQDRSGNITKYVKIDPVNGKIFETTAAPGEDPVTNEISYNKLITRLTDGSGMSVEEATNLMGLNLEEIRKKFTTKRGSIKKNKGTSSLPDVMGKNERFGAPVFQNYFKKQIKNKDFSITEPTDGADMLLFTNSAGGKFNYYTFEDDITSGNTEAQNMALEAWIKSAKDLNK